MGLRYTWAINVVLTEANIAKYVRNIQKRAVNIGKLIHLTSILMLHFKKQTKAAVQTQQSIVIVLKKGIDIAQITKGANNTAKDKKKKEIAVFQLSSLRLNISWQ